MKENQLKIEKPQIINKGWGYELIIGNYINEYCGKILHFNANGISSLHLHLDKHETWYIVKGNIKIRGININTAEGYEIIANEGDVINITRGIPHQVCAITESDVFEISTPDNDDNIRLMKGDSQK